MEGETDFLPRELSGSVALYRGAWRRFIINTTPKGVKLRPFIREKKDDDGLSVRMSPEQCFEREIEAIVTIATDAVTTVLNPLNSQPLRTVQDRDDHAFIDNIPFQHEHQKAAEDIALKLAKKATVLDEEQYSAAKGRYELAKTPSS